MNSIPIQYRVVLTALAILATVGIAALAIQSVRPTGPGLPQLIGVGAISGDRKTREMVDKKLLQAGIVGSMEGSVVYGVEVVPHDVPRAVEVLQRIRREYPNRVVFVLGDPPYKRTAATREL